MSIVRVNGVNLYYEVHGAGEPLLLIMGLGANATAWELQIAAFSREYQVIAFDNRGAGRSDKPNEPYSMPQMAEDAAAILDELGVVSAHVFGMSMGGMIAQELALLHPEKVRTLALGGTSPGGPAARLPPPATIQQWIALAAMPMSQAIVAGMTFLYSDEFIAANKERLLKRALEHAHLFPPLYALQRQVMAVLSFNAYGRLHKLELPTLVLTGTADKIIPHENSRVLAQRIPGAQLVEFAGAGHGFLVECAAQANGAVLDFLRPHRGHFVPAK